MPNLADLIQQKNHSDDQWKAERQAERENMVAMQDSGVNEIVSSPQAYEAYLEIQANNPVYSAGNVALAYVQNPNVTQFGTVDRWKTLGRSVKDSEKNNGIQIFAKGSFSKGYTISPAYDISQTTGRDVVNRVVQENSNEMDTALTTAMNYSPVPIVMDSELAVPAYYDSSHLELAINPAAGKAEAFPYIVAEVAHAKFHNKGKNIYYDRKECNLDAQSIAYLVSKRFGIKCDMPDASFVTDLYAGYMAPQIRLALSSIQDMSKNIGGSIEKNIAPQTKGRASMYRPTR